MLRVLSIVALFMWPVHAMAEEPAHFISDDVFIYIHGGPGKDYRIIGSVEAGMPITKLNKTEGDYTEIIDSKGRQGWVVAKLVTDKPSFRHRFPVVESELIKASEQLNTISLSSDDIDEYKQVTEQKLTELNLALVEAVKQRDAALAQVVTDIDNQRYEMWQQGGIIAGIGALLGIFLVYLPRPQRRKRGRWMS